MNLNYITYFSSIIDRISNGEAVNFLQNAGLSKDLDQFKI